MILGLDHIIIIQCERLTTNFQHVYSQFLVPATHRSSLELKSFLYFWPCPSRLVSDPIKPPHPTTNAKENADIAWCSRYIVDSNITAHLITITLGFGLKSNTTLLALLSRGSACWALVDMVRRKFGPRATQPRCISFRPLQRLYKMLSTSCRTLTTPGRFVITEGAEEKAFGDLILMLG